MERTVVVISLFILLFGCTSEEHPIANGTEKNGGSLNTPSVPVNNQTNAELPTVSQLRGCIPGYSFSYRITSSLPNSSSESLLKYTIEKGEPVNGKSSVLKTISWTDSSDSAFTTKEWDSVEDCSCLKKETVVEYMGERISLNDSCPKDIWSVASAPEISYSGEESVSVPAYSGMAKRYGISFENESSDYSYWFAERIEVPVKTVYSAGEMLVVEELVSYR